jgi:hypothetical protein
MNKKSGYFVSVQDSRNHPDQSTRIYTTFKKARRAALEIIEDWKREDEAGAFTAYPDSGLTRAWAEAMCRCYGFVAVGGFVEIQPNGWPCTRRVSIWFDC